MHREYWQNTNITVSFDQISSKVHIKNWNNGWDSQMFIQILMHYVRL